MCEIRCNYNNYNCIFTMRKCSSLDINLYYFIIYYMEYPYSAYSRSRCCGPYYGCGPCYGPYDGYFPYWRYGLRYPYLFYYDRYYD